MLRHPPYSRPAARWTDCWGHLTADSSMQGREGGGVLQGAQARTIIQVRRDGDAHATVHRCLEARLHAILEAQDGLLVERAAAFAPLLREWAAVAACEGAAVLAPAHACMRDHAALAACTWPCLLPAEGVDAAVAGAINPVGVGDHEVHDAPSALSSPGVWRTAARGGGGGGGEWAAHTLLTAAFLAPGPGDSRQPTRACPLHTHRSTIWMQRDV